MRGVSKYGRKAVCHPERRNFGFGKCSTCYFQDRPKRKMKQMGLTQLGESLQAVMPTFRRVPDYCPRCENKALRHYEDSPEVTCIICGWEGLFEPPIGPHGLKWR